MESNTTVQDNNPEKRAIIPDIMSQLDYGDNDPNLSSESVMYTPKDERTPSESLKKAKELEKSLPISKKEKAAVDALLDMYVLDETKEKEIAMNIDKKSRKIRKRYTSSPSNLVLKLSIEKDGKYKLKRGGKRRNRKTIPLTQYGGSPQDDFFDAIEGLLDGETDTTLEKLIEVFISKPPIDINARNNKGETALAMLVTGLNRNQIPLKKCAEIAQIRVKLVKLLLENGALIGATAHGRGYELVTISKRYGWKPLRCIENDLYSAQWKEEIEHARLKMADLLLMHGSVNQPIGFNRRTPLYYAVWRLDVPYVKLLLERGANVQAKDIYGKTPLMLLRSVNVASWLLPSDPMSTLDGRRLVQSTIYQIESILLKHYAKRNTKQRLVDQMGPPNMKDLQETAELPRGSRIQAEPDDYPFFYEESSYPLRNDGDGIIRKNIKSYLGGNRTRNLLKYKIKESVLS